MKRKAWIPLFVLLLATSAAGGWDPLQKAERSAARAARLFAEGDSLGAIDAYLEAQALAPDDARIGMGLGEAFYGNGEFKSALGQYRALGSPSPERPQQTGFDALYNAGNSAFAMGDYEQALESYTRALIAGSTDPDLLHNLELTQRILEQAESEQSQQDGGEGEQSEQQQEQEQEQDEGQNQEQNQDQSEQQENSQDEQREEEQEGEQEQSEQEQQEQEQQSAPPDSLSTAAADSVLAQEGMTLAEALQLLEALDHDEEELRKSIMRRLRAGESESENDW